MLIKRQEERCFAFRTNLEEIMIISLRKVSLYFVRIYFLNNFHCSFSRVADNRSSLSGSLVQFSWTHQPNGVSFRVSRGHQKLKWAQPLPIPFWRYHLQTVQPAFLFLRQPLYCVIMQKRKERERGERKKSEKGILKRGHSRQKADSSNLYIIQV